MSILFDHFEVLAESPKGIKKLRESILQWAVQGKLEPQDPQDEPAAVLLEKIKAEKERMIKEGKLKAEKPLPPISEEEKPYELPKGWEWVRLGEISKNIHYGYTASADVMQKKVRLLRITDIQDDHVNWDTVPGCEISDLSLKSFELNNGDLLIARTGGTIGKTYLVENITVCAVFASYLIRVVPSYFIYPLFLKIFTGSNLYWSQLYSKCTGTGQPNVNGRSLSSLILPLPPFKEQERIVAKVDRLMALCDELEKQEAERDQKQAEMNTACLEKLLVSREPGETRVQWQRIDDHFDILYNKPGNVEKLKQAILQMAVQGKLEPQDPQDEPAAVLLEKIKAEKERLIKEGKLKAEKPLPPISEEEKPYELPKGWEWSRLDTICYLITDGTHHTPKYLPMGIPFLSVKDISSGLLDFSSTKYISIDAHEELKKRCNPEFGDILFTKVGTTGIAKAIDIKREFSIFVSLALLKLPKNYLNSEFMERLLNSPLVKKYSEEGTEGVGNKNLVLRKIKAFIVPIPPLNEQKRIVAKVDRLMAMCEGLGEGLRQAETLREKLFQAVLAQTLPGKSW